MRHQRNEERGSQGRGQSRYTGGSGDRSYGRQQREDESMSGWQDRDDDRSSQFGQYGQSSNQFNQSGSQYGGQYGQQYGQQRSQQGSRGSRDYQDFSSEGYRPSESYRSDDYDMQSSGRGGSSYDDYGSREYQGLGTSRQTSRDQNQGYSSTYGSRDLDFGSASSSRSGSSSGYESSFGRNMPSGYGRGSYNEDEYRSGGSSGQYGRRDESRGESGGFFEGLKGLFSGRGPKGYKRSDERIKEDVSEALTRDEHIDASDIEIEVKDGEVTLTGNVPERRMKHLAEDCVEKCMGVKDVTNRLRVQKENQRGQQQGQEGREASSSLSEGDGGERKESKSSSTSAGQMSGSKKSGSSTGANPQH